MEFKRLLLPILAASAIIGFPESGCEREVGHDITHKIYSCITENGFRVMDREGNTFDFPEETDSLYAFKAGHQIAVYTERYNHFYLRVINLETNTISPLECIWSVSMGEC